jgi:hypothetical protein
VLSFNVHSNIKAFEKKLSALAYKQLPFATAQALTALAKKAADAEKANEEKVLDRPRPFTQNAIRVRAANKNSQAATVWMMDKTARYLEPYQFGGNNVLNSKALLKPVAAAADLDQYGNLPRNFIRQMRGRSDVFVGTVKTKHGPISGIWQRAGAEDSFATHTRVTKTGRVIVKKVAAYVSTRSDRKLKLLIEFKNAHPVRQNLRWFDVGRETVLKQFNREFGRALARAIASAK